MIWSLPKCILAAAIIHCVALISFLLSGSATPSLPPPKKIHVNTVVLQTPTPPSPTPQPPRPTPKKKVEEIAEKPKPPEQKKPPEKKKISRDQLKSALAALNQNQTSPTLKKNSNIEKIDHLQVDSSTDFVSIEDASYTDLLAQSLHSQLRLPEKGDVTLELTLEKSGKVKKLEILESPSEKNKTYISDRLPKLKLPPFEKEFSSKTEYTFTLTLTSDK